MGFVPGVTLPTDCELADDTGTGGYALPAAPHASDDEDDAASSDQQQGSGNSEVEEETGHMNLREARPQALKSQALDQEKPHAGDDQ